LSSISGEGNGKPIYVGSPFSGYPRVKEGFVSAKQHTLLVDSNIFGDIWQSRNTDNIKKLLIQSSNHQLNFSILYAAAETYLNYHAPDEAIDEFFQALRDDYGVNYPVENIVKLKNIVKDNLAGIQNNIGLIRDYLVIVKNIFLMSGGVKKHVEALTEIVKYNNLPQFGFAMLLSLVLFYARKNQSEFEKGMIKKIDKDMQVKKNREEEELLLDNVARDICLYLACTEAFYHFSDQVNEICWLASGDATIGLMLSEINFTNINYREVCPNNKTTKFMSEVNLKEDAKSYATLKPLLEKFWGKNLNAPSLESEDIHEKRLNLRRYAESIMNNYQWQS
jgi:hypothetical protein